MYEEPGPTREEIDASRGLLALEFGANGCGYCQAAQPSIVAALAGRPEVRHVKVADGPGRPLGRTFRVKLWPTLILLRDGVEVARIVRPTSEPDVTSELTTL